MTIATLSIDVMPLIGIVGPGLASHSDAGPTFCALARIRMSESLIVDERPSMIVPGNDGLKMLRT